MDASELSVGEEAVRSVRSPGHAPERELLRARRRRLTPTPTRCCFAALGSATAGALAAGAVGAGRLRSTLAEHGPDRPTTERPAPEENPRFYSPQETTLTLRNHGLAAEFVDRPVTPLSAHYLMIHRVS